MADFNISLEKLIPSLAIREQCLKEKREFTPFEQATLLYNNPMITSEEMVELLRTLRQSLQKNQDYKELCEQINQVEDFYRESHLRFFNEEEKQYYVLSYFEKGSRKYIQDNRIFEHYLDVQNYVVKEISTMTVNGEILQNPFYKDEYKITKHYLNSEETIPLINRINGSQIAITLEKVNWPDIKHFSNAFVEVPFPFRNGDIVSSLCDSDVGIFMGCKDEEEYVKGKLYRSKLIQSFNSLDSTDISARVESLQLLNPNTNQVVFQHHHHNLLDLDYGEITPEDSHYDLLKSASELVKGKGSLEIFCSQLLQNE